MLSPFAIFLLRTYVLNIPVALEEAAQVDGAGLAVDPTPSRITQGRLRRSGVHSNFFA